MMITTGESIYRLVSCVHFILNANWHFPERNRDGGEMESQIKGITMSINYTELCFSNTFLYAFNKIALLLLL